MSEFDSVLAHKFDTRKSFSAIIYWKSCGVKYGSSMYSLKVFVLPHLLTPGHTQDVFMNKTMPDCLHLFVWTFDIYSVDAHSDSGFEGMSTGKVSGSGTGLSINIRSNLLSNELPRFSLSLVSISLLPGCSICDSSHCSCNFSMPRECQCASLWPSWDCHFLLVCQSGHTLQLPNSITYLFLTRGFVEGNVFHCIPVFKVGPRND